MPELPCRVEYIGIIGPESVGIEPIFAFEERRVVVTMDLRYTQEPHPIQRTGRYV